MSEAGVLRAIWIERGRGGVTDAALPGLKDAMWPDWSGAAYAQVTRGGGARVGDEVRWIT
ncbi:MAG TPA: hypothetical protein VMN39_00840 [Longimicrobiaceae bacterium]|nr:hypothetical protein [Longimicrobiaceae bacterium]